MKKRFMKKTGKKNEETIVEPKRKTYNIFVD